MSIALNLSGKKVLVLGGNGFLGQHLVKTLRADQATVDSPSSKILDLTRHTQTLDYFRSFPPNYVINCAGFNGGISFNKKYPADIYLANARMSLNVLEACTLTGVQKVISVMTSCSYPDGEAVLKEENFWDGLPHSSVEAHGLAKRSMDGYSRALNTQYKLSAHTAIVTNLYGPGDTFSERGKVVSMLVRKVMDAYLNDTSSVEVWGTGEPRRDLLYVEDAAALLVEMLKIYDDTSLPLNIGSGADVSIKELVALIAELIGYKGKIFFNSGYADGQMRKLLDTSRMKDILKVTPSTSLKEGLQHTIHWYAENKEYADQRF